MKFSLVSWAALSVLTVPSAFATTAPTECLSVIRAHLKRQYREAFFHSSGRTKRKVGEIECEPRLSRAGKRYYDCDIWTSNYLTPKGKDVGSGSHTYMLRMSEDCSVQFSTISGEE